MFDNLWSNQGQQKTPQAKTPSNNSKGMFSNLYSGETQPHTFINPEDRPKSASTTSISTSKPFKIGDTISKIGNTIGGAIKGVEQKAETVIKGLTFKLQPPSSTKPVASGLSIANAPTPTITPVKIQTNNKKTFYDSFSETSQKLAKVEGKIMNFPVDIVKGLAKAYVGGVPQGNNEYYDYDTRQTSTYKPKNAGEKVGSFLNELMFTVVQGEAGGINQALGTGTKTFGALLKTEPAIPKIVPFIGGKTVPIGSKVAFVQDVVEKFASKQFNTFINRLKPLKITIQDLQDVNSIKGGTPEQLARYEQFKELVSQGLSPQSILAAAKNSRTEFKTTVYNFIKGAIDTVTTTLKKSLTKEEQKLLKSGLENDVERVIGTGEHTPQEVLNKVINSEIEKTPEGKQIIKMALEAQEQGTNIVVEKPRVVTEELDNAITQYRADQGVNIKPDKTVEVSPALEKLTELSQTPEIQAITQAKVKLLPIDKEGNITLYRVGTLRAGDNRLVSASYTKEAAEAFKELHKETFGDRPITEFKVKPEDIRMVLGGQEKEVLVKNIEPLAQEARKYKIDKVLTQEESVLKPTEAKTEEEVISEVKKVGLEDAGVLKFKTAGSGVQGAYRRPVVGRTELKIFVDNSPEFKVNPVFTVTKDKDLEFIGKKTKILVKPAALQIQPENLKVGEKIRVDINSLKGTKAQQMRVSRGGEVLGFNPKNLQDPFSPKATKELKKVVKQSEIAKTLSEKLNIPIRRGKFRHAGAIGIYKPGQKVVRIKSGGIQTVFHEVAHYLDDTIGFSKVIDIKERKALMEEYGHSYEGQPNKQRKEAFAEFIRFKLTGQNEKIATWAPKFSKVFDEKIATMPEVEGILNTARIDYQRWAEQPASAKILSQISIGSQNKGSLKDRVTTSIHDLYTSSLDDLHPLSEFSAIANRELGKIPATKDPYVLARNFRGWTGKADLFLNKGTFGKTFWKKDDKGKTVMDFKGKSYSEIMKPVEEAGKLDEFRVYIVSQRIVNDLAPRRIKTGINLTDAKTALEELGKKNPEFEKIAAERRVYKDQLLDFAKDNGLIGEEGLAKIKELNKFHVPFYRVMEETQTRFMGKTKIAGNISSPIKKIKGSEREIIDPLESDVKDTYAIINAAERNNIGVAMANISSMNFELGRLFEKVDRPMVPVTVNVQEVIEKSLKDAGLDPEDLPEGLGKEVVTLFRPTYSSAPNTLNVNMGDKQLVFQVDPDLFNSIQGLNAEDAGTIMRILSMPAKALRAGATLSPDFSLRNPLRDQFTAMVYSKHGFTPGVDLVKGIFELYKKGDVYDLWKAGGGEHAMLVSLDRTALQKNLKQTLESRGAKGLNYAKNPLRLLQILSELGEAGTRLGEMRQALRAGADPIESAFASREITLDFARIGSKTKAINMINAFFNSSLQGTDKMVRAFKDKPFRTLLKSLIGITLPSILLYYANRDDPRWKEIPRWQKDLFWIVMTPDHVYRIPKPFELGILFGSVPERILEVIDNKDPELFKELGKSIANGLTPGFMPTFLTPVIENISNYSFFLDRPIVSRGQEGLPAEQQAGTYTSEIAKLLGGVLKYSPSKIDNLVSGYTGGLGKYATQGIDKILVGTGVSSPPSAPAMTLEDSPILKSFLIRKPIGSGSESVNKLYNMYSKSDAEYTYVSKLIKSGQTAKAEEYVKKHPGVATAPILRQTVTQFGEMNRLIDAIRNSRELTPEQKREKINQIGELQTDIARKVIRLLIYQDE